MIEQDFFSRLENWLRANTLAWSEIASKKHWLRSVRKTRGLRGLDMAKKLGVSPSRISMLESDEGKGAVTLKMMQKAALALDCEFVYALVPKKILHGSQAQKPRLRIESGKPEPE